MSEMISVASGFQYSVNIAYDLNDEDKIKNFIPTGSALQLLEDIGSLSNVVEKYYRKILGCLCSTALPCFVIEHIEDAATEVFKVPKPVADTL